MSSLVSDILIWVLLAGGIGFSLLGFFGLLIFPDIRSRMFTASRATLFGACLVAGAVVLYSATAFIGRGTGAYILLAAMTVFLCGIMAVAHICISRIITDRVLSEDTGGSGASAPSL